MTFAKLGAAALLAVALGGPATTHAQSFSNEEQSCVLYGQWAVQEIKRAQAMGCDVIKAKEKLDPRDHMKWCMGQTNEMMRKAPLIHRTGVAHRCAWQDVNVTGR